MAARNPWTSEALQNWSTDVAFGLDFIERSKEAAAQLPDDVMVAHDAAVTAVNDLILMIVKHSL